MVDRQATRWSIPVVVVPPRFAWVISLIGPGTTCLLINCLRDENIFGRCVDRKGERRTANLVEILQASKLSRFACRCD